MRNFFSISILLIDVMAKTTKKNFKSQFPLSHKRTHTHTCSYISLLQKNEMKWNWKLNSIFFLLQCDRRNLFHSNSFLQTVQNHYDHWNFLTKIFPPLPQSINKCFVISIWKFCLVFQYLKEFGKKQNNTANWMFVCLFFLLVSFCV